MTAHNVRGDIASGHRDDARQESRSLAPGLIKFSDDVVNLIGAFIDSGAVTSALQGIESGLRWLDSSLGSAAFKRDGRIFLDGLDRLSRRAPALITLMQIEGALGVVGLGRLLRSLKRVTINGTTFWIR